MQPSMHMDDGSLQHSQAIEYVQTRPMGASALQTWPLNSTDESHHLFL